MGSLLTAHPNDPLNSSIHTRYDGTRVHSTEGRGGEAAYSAVYLLQSVIDNVDVGILLIEKEGGIAFWNNTFLVQSNVPPFVIMNCKNIYALQNCAQWSGLSLSMAGERTQIVHDNLVVERNIAILPDGNTLCTFTNVTSQHHYAETLKQKISSVIGEF